MKRYGIVIEKSQANYAAYVPDLPGCVATGPTVEETERLLREAMEIHVQGLREDGLPVPEPTSVVDYVEVSAILGERRGVSPPVLHPTGGLTPRRSPTCHLPSFTQKGSFSIWCYLLQ